MSYEVTVEARGMNDEYLGVFTQPVGRHMHLVVAPDPSTVAPTATNTPGDTLRVDTSFCPVSPDAIPPGSSFAIRKTTSIKDLFFDTFDNKWRFPVDGSLLIRRPGNVDLTVTFSDNVWEVNLNGGPVHYMGDGANIRLLPDEAVSVEIPVNPSFFPAGTGCPDVMAMGTIGHVPMSRINAYVHPDSQLNGPEFKGINYPVVAVQVGTGIESGLNSSGLLESKFFGPDGPTTGSTTFLEASWFQFDAIWRLACGTNGMILSSTFPILLNAGIVPTEIGMWGLDEDPEWAAPNQPNSSGWVPDPWINDEHYWLWERKHWTAFDVALPSSNSNSNHRRHQDSAFAAIQEENTYPLFGGRGIACDLDDDISSSLRWVRPVPYSARNSKAAR